MTLLAATLLLASTTWFGWRRLQRYLHIYQQEEYNSFRFLNWLFKSFSLDRKATAALALVLIASLVLPASLPWLQIGCAAFIFWVALREADPLTAAKKPLVLTLRAQRIRSAAALLIGLAAILALIATSSSTLTALVTVQVIPFMLAVGNWALAPVEQRIQDKFRNEAVTRLADIDPTVIGITGSFGKTSAKHMLGHILSFDQPTLVTPGSINTVMGITRVIREQLVNGTKFFVVEMGAYGIQSIDRLCRLTPPKHGMITAIGAAHYERFKTLDAVARAKFELAEAVVASGGRMVIAEQVLEQTYAADFVTKNRESFITVGTNSDQVDVLIESGETTADGISLKLHGIEGAVFDVVVPIYGRHHISNVALSIAMAQQLGVANEAIRAALQTLPQIRHRLELRKGFNGARVIDDAYNSNPTGFESALELLDLLNTAGGRRILVTPGMAELGAKHDEEHARLGAIAAAKTDIVIAVRPDRIQPFIEAVTAAATSELKTVDSFAEARTWLEANVSASDVVLLENDLPDLIERTFPV